MMLSSIRGPKSMHLILETEEEVLSSRSMTWSNTEVLTG
jgi:hypothetical protein